MLEIGAAVAARGDADTDIVIELAADDPCATSSTGRR